MLGLAPPQQYRREVQVLHKKEGGEKMPKKALHMRLKTGPYSISCADVLCSISNVCTGTVPDTTPGTYFE